MEELIAQITEKTGVSAEKAKEIVGVVTEWLKDKLPEEMINQIGGMLSGAGDVASSAAGKATDAAGSAAGSAGDIAGDLLDKAKGVIPGFGNKGE
ncbi:MAG: TetR-like C-terminal domain-containing protein [Planctomycetota bacterium]